ncbi:multicomponent Na+:H+ antiporter subunit D [Lipingzhangella halophila]|uniref:Multicomponent Na+:H+ antiporter subunit D n=1 Tax=Lipingzhangella halophila TaxID=1783352 RepID=A0A7W7W163_9ACTN|nr:monovalent cation/H+ antiporter subunit D family protein [Lipingzhangella halophila]MBB4929429.1 multicomponent Na+:H+ antiporter subunit D [Lipingzhangella halophila]
MIADALPLVLAGPLVAAAVLMVLRRPVWGRRAVLLGTLGAALAYGITLVAATYGGTVLVADIGLWPGGIAIPFAADMFSALMVTATALLTLVCVVFGIVAGEDEQHYFAPFVLALYGGVAGAMLTADLFNLFVCIEVMLLPSYVLISMFGGENRLRAGRIYITYNLLASAVFLFGVAFVYGVLGTVNFAELAGTAKESTAVAVAIGVVLVALAMKSGVVPVHGWLPRTYPETSPTVAAIFSGLHTKVGIYAIYRVYSLVFDGDERFLGFAVLFVCVTMVFGALSAVGERTIRAVLAFNMVSGVGYILLGVALFGPLGLAAGIFYLLHHMVVKTSLFLSAGAVEVRYGTQRLDQLGGLARKEPLLAFAFVGAALSLIGMPPFSGFAGKFALLQASVAEHAYLASFVILAASLLTLLSMNRLWNGVFWGPVQREPADAVTETDTDTAAPGAIVDGASDDGAGGAPASNGAVGVVSRRRAHAKAASPLTHVSPALAAPAVVLTLVSLAIGLGAEGLLTLTQQAAAGLIDTSSYVEAVMRE